ncbi:protein arginine N-methyltransferase 6-like [Saccoglossus kowalevskii]|uniref:Protein arginine N-methyltransferase 6 n=1 Tax=Saccoglossus kowalevskii TaxID=10224 RepID=A0ABM0MLX2_SACKO|nr:PREDICTED: protein arginine N-methyltransferase 6-like [Saccoglossus kowalevskii]
MDIADSSSDVIAKRPKSSRNDDDYFRSYADLAVHEEMLRDTVRTNAYRIAILGCCDQIAGKVVADIGAGTGILSCFCVQAGAKKVYAIEASGIVHRAAEVVKSNNMEDKIEIIRGRVEEVELPENVDVIVSEWMGYFLLYESMLGSVIYARDKWLKDTGILLPNTASIYMAPLTCQEYGEECTGSSNEQTDAVLVDTVEMQVKFWESMKQSYGVDMSCIAGYAKQNFLSRVHLGTISPQYLLSHPCKVLEIDIKSITQTDLNKLTGNFKFQCFGNANIYGFAGWFSVSFPCMKDVKISTSPLSHPTHWQQCILYIESPTRVEQDTVIEGNASFMQNKTMGRFLDVSLQYSVGEKNHGIRHFTLDDLCIS